MWTRFFAAYGVVSLATLVATPTSAQNPPARDETVFHPEDLFALSVAGDVQIRRDGGSVAYVRTVNDVMIDRGRTAIWFVNTRTGEQTPLGGVPADTDVSQPRWSPDGTRLAFVGTPEGGKAGLYMFWVASGRTALIASPARAPSELAWSPDGRTLAFLMSAPEPAETLGEPVRKPEGAKWAEPIRIISRVEYKRDGIGERKPGYSHVFVVPADGGTPRALTSGSFEDSGPLAWTPDGSNILFTSRRGLNWQLERDLYAIHSVSVSTGLLTALTGNKGPDTSASVSPDGRHVAFTGYTQRYRGYESRQLYLMDVDGRNLHTLPSPADRSVDKAQPRWAADGKSLYIGFEDRGEVKVANVGLDGRVRTMASGIGGADGISDTPYSGGSFSVARDGTIAFARNSVGAPADVAIAKAGRTTRLTQLNDAFLAHKRLGALRPLAVTSHVDQVAVAAWMVTPPNFDPSRRYPLILEVHGGPFAAYGPSFATDDQLYAAAGYVVLYVNPRGSTGYGEAFANGINHTYPGTDYEDLMSAVDAAIAKGFVDPERLFVTGVSGGGALTTWIVGKTHRFKAAVAQAPPVDWTSEVLTVDFYPWMGRQWFGKQPWEDHELYWQRSPLSLVGNVTTPTMLMVGDIDMRTPPSQAEEYFGALQIRNVPTTLVKIPGAAHTTLSARPSQSSARINAILAWFARFDPARAKP